MHQPRRPLGGASARGRAPRACGHVSGTPGRPGRPARSYRVRRVGRVRRARRGRRRRQPPSAPRRRPAPVPPRGGDAARHHPRRPGPESPAVPPCRAAPARTRLRRRPVTWPARSGTSLARSGPSSSFRLAVAASPPRPGLAPAGSAARHARAPTDRRALRRGTHRAGPRPGAPFRRRRAPEAAPPAAPPKRACPRGPRGHHTKGCAASVPGTDRPRVVRMPLRPACPSAGERAAGPTAVARPAQRRCVVRGAEA